MMMVTTMKREREVDSLAMANYLMLLSGGELEKDYSRLSPNNSNRVFECKTCNRQFSSFQALGGHRASHKKPRLSDHEEEESDHHGLSPPKPKTHECSVCGLEFAIGQALGGHMRRHRSNSSSKGGSGSAARLVDNSANNRSKRVLFLDLNLTPLENDLEFLKLGQQRVATPLVHCFN